jgi:hypothetical protein
MLPDEPNLEFGYCSEGCVPGPGRLFREVPRSGEIEIGKGLFVKIVEEDSSDWEESMDVDDVDWRG